MKAYKLTEHSRKKYIYIKLQISKKQTKNFSETNRPDEFNTETTKTLRIQGLL